MLDVIGSFAICAGPWLGLLYLAWIHSGLLLPLTVVRCGFILGAVLITREMGNK